MGCPKKRPRCQGMVSTKNNQQQKNDATDEKQIEIK